MKTEVRKDRVGVLASTIVKELASARVREIEREPVDLDGQQITVTPQMKRLLARFTVAARRESDARRAKNAIEHQITELGFRVVREEGKPWLFRWPYRREEQRRAETRAIREKRARTVRELRAQALIDLVTLDPREAKAAVRKFRDAIEKV